MADFGKVRKQVSIYGVATFFTIFCAFPFYWMLITTFKRDSDLFNPTNDPFILNAAPTLDHLRVLFFHTLFLRYLLNTFVVGAAVVIITLLVSVPAAYSLTRWAGRWGEGLGIGIFLTYLVPPTLLFIPLSRVVAFFGLTESIGSLILVYPTFTIPFCTWLLMGFFKSIPPDIE